MTLPDDTEPSAEALLEQACKAAFTECAPTGVPGNTVPDDLACWPIYRKHLLIALDRFRAAGAREERGRALTIIDNYRGSISSLTEVAETVRTNLGFVADAIRSGASPS